MYRQFRTYRTANDITNLKQGFWYSPESGEKDSAGYSPE